MSSSTSTVAGGIQSCRRHQSRVYEPQFSSQSTSGSSRGAGWPCGCASAERLREAAPEGLHVYLDNVGGDHLEAAIGALRDHGRIAWCGAVAQYNRLGNPPAAPCNLFDVVGKSLRLEGFLVRNHLDARPELYDFLVPHLRSGAVVPDETVVDGFDRVVDAFLGMLRGANTGKMLVRIAD